MLNLLSRLPRLELFCLLLSAIFLFVAPLTNRAASMTEAMSQKQFSDETIPSQQREQERRRQENLRQQQQERLQEQRQRQQDLWDRQQQRWQQNQEQIQERMRQRQQESRQRQDDLRQQSL